MTKWKVFFFYAVIMSVLIAIACAMAEIYLRVAYLNIDLLALTGEKQETSINPFAEWAVTDAFAAYTAKPGRYAGRAKKTVNSYGFISTPELPLSKPSGTIRVVFLGGSSTAGTGKDLPDTETWPWQTIEMLKAQFPSASIDFLNGALGGYSSFESYGRLWSRIRFFAPDIIVVYHGWNEMYYWRKETDILKWRVLPDGSWQVDHPVNKKSIRLYAPLAIDPLLSFSQVFSRLRLRFSEPLSGEVSPESMILANDYDSRGLDVWRTHLRLFRETAKILNAELFVAKQATLIVRDLSADKRKTVRYNLHGFDHQAHVDGFAQLYRIIEEEIPIDHIIETNVLSGIPEMFYDHIHPTPEGAKRIAAIVSAEIATSSRFDPFRALPPGLSGTGNQ